MIRNVKEKQAKRNTYFSDSNNLSYLQRQNLLSDLDENAMMQIEEAVAANMRRRDEKFIQNHPYAITQYKDGRWATNVYDSSGKRKTIACHSLEQLHIKLIEHYRKLEADQAITFPMVCKEWLDEKNRHKEITPASYTKYIGDYRRFFIDREDDFCKMSVTEITDSDLRRFIKDAIVDMSLTKKTYKQMKILLKGALLYAKEEGYTDFSAGTFFFDLVLSDRLFAHKEKPADETQVFTDEEVLLLMDFMWAEQDIRGLGLILMFQTGMRVGELSVLRRENIQDGSIRVTATEETYYDPEIGKRVSEPVDHAKTDAGERTILLPESAEKTLKAIWSINPFGEFLFMDKQGRRIRANRFNHWLHRTCKKVGIPERSTHKIRKTYASILLSNKVDERLVINQMGHTDISTTRGSYYFNRNSEDKNKGIISSAINF